MSRALFFFLQTFIYPSLLEEKGKKNKRKLKLNISNQQWATKESIWLLLSSDQYMQACKSFPRLPSMGEWVRTYSLFTDRLLQLFSWPLLLFYSRGNVFMVYLVSWSFRCTLKLFFMILSFIFFQENCSTSPTSSLLQNIRSFIVYVSIVGPISLLLAR